MKKLSLSSDIISSADLRQVIAELEEFKKEFARNALKARIGKPDKKVELELSNHAKCLITDWQAGESLDLGLLESLLTELSRYLKTATLVKVTLSAVPTMNVKRIIADWFRTNIATSLLIDFSYNSALLGGMAVSIGSHVYDWSFRRQIIGSKDKLIEVITHV